MFTIGGIVDTVESIAPRSWAFSFDKVGLQIGDPEAPVTKVAFSLDSSLSAARFAADTRCQLLVAHHPLLFHPIDHLRPGTHVQNTVIELVRSGVALLVAHTNWDCAPGGINDALAEKLHLADVSQFGSAQAACQPEQPAGRIGRLDTPLSANALQLTVDARLGSRSQMWLPESSGPIETVAVVGGSAASEWQLALEAGAQALVTGEVPQHIALEAAEAGMTILAAGHYHTEQPGVVALAKLVRTVTNVDVLVFEPDPGQAGRPV